MKMQVVMPTPEKNVVFLDEVDSDKYYGVIWQGNERCSIQSTGYKTGIFVAKCNRGLTYQNHFGCPTELVQFIEYQCIKDNRPVYQFDTAKELFAWLAE
jgi:hypothetical protein